MGCCRRIVTNGTIEAIHDEFTGEMKLCETGKTYAILNLEQKRKKEGKTKAKKKYSKIRQEKTNVRKGLMGFRSSQKYG